MPTFSERGPKAAAFVLLALLSAGRPAAAEQSTMALQARQIQWSADNLTELRQLFKDTRAVRTFINEIAGEGRASEPGMIGDVKEYEFVDLNSDGRLELVALADVSGRGFYNNVEIVYSRPDAAPDPLTYQFRGFVLKSIDGFEVDTLASKLKDIDGDGRMEILVPQALEPYEGAAKPVAVLTEVYRWNGRDYEKASARYPAYYRDVALPALERELRQLDAVSEEMLAPNERLQHQLARNRIVTEIAAARARVR